nr:MAG TPA: Skp1 family protein [Caudoviricetes sp.]
MPDCVALVICTTNIQIRFIAGVIKGTSTSEVRGALNPTN